MTIVARGESFVACNHDAYFGICGAETKRGFCSRNRAQRRDKDGKLHTEETCWQHRELRTP